MIEIQPEGVWLLAEEIPYTVHADTELATDIEKMACDETLINWGTSDPLVRELCDLWEIPYKVLPD